MSHHVVMSKRTGESQRVRVNGRPNFCLQLDLIVSIEELRERLREAMDFKHKLDHDELVEGDRYLSLGAVVSNGFYDKVGPEMVEVIEVEERSD